MNHRLIIPFLTGQRRDGLCRIRDIDGDVWDILDVPDFSETDIGDANEKLHRMGIIYRRLSESVERILNHGLRPVCVAGDCISTLGVLSGLQHGGKEPDRILWLDAHGDFHTWETTQTKYLGGMPLAFLVGKGDRRKRERDSVAAFTNMVGVRAYPEKRIVLSDARDLDVGEREAVQNSGITVCKLEDIFTYLSIDESIYLHFDTDVIDAEVEMPALKYHVKHGPGYADIAQLFRMLRNRKIVAISVSAWHEEMDKDDKTAIACLSLLKELE
ncbi:arginase family protein [Undibacterium sp. Ji49W]|uniref:arginase family protein n=1 Tax=Undibacterium sp. Ji49W TaxID=3413040 RepID=UPI003BF3AAAE